MKVSRPFERLLHRYVQALITQIARSAACNRTHSIDERAGRWLLLTHDRAGRDEFPLTQEFLAQMLGVRRPSVTIAAGMLQKAGFIRYSRGRVTVVDREAWRMRPATATGSSATSTSAFSAECAFSTGTGRSPRGWSDFFCSIPYRALH